MPTHDDNVDDDADDHDDAGDVDADACAEYDDAVDADVVGGVDVIVANGRHGEVEPATDADGVRDFF